LSIYWLISNLSNTKTKHQFHPFFLNVLYGEIKPLNKIHTCFIVKLFVFFTGVTTEQKSVVSLLVWVGLKKCSLSIPLLFHLSANVQLNSTQCITFITHFLRMANKNSSLKTVEEI
jgi:hypothetical protein